MTDSKSSKGALFVVTRPAEQGERSLQFLQSRGVAAILRPLIAITSLPRDPGTIKHLSALLQSDATLYVCTSPQSVREVYALVGDVKPPSCRVLAQGPRTAAAWTEAFGSPPHHVCQDSRATSIAPLVAGMTDERTVVIITGPLDRESPVATAITEVGIRVERIPLYQTLALPFTESELLEWRNYGTIVLLLYSPSAVEAVRCSPIGNYEKVSICCFGSTTAAAAERLGLQVAVANAGGRDDEFLSSSLKVITNLCK